MTRLLSRFLADESAATALEYALIGVGISVVIVTAVQMVGTNLSGYYDAIATATAAK